MNVIKPKHFDSVTTDHGDVMYYKNKSESIWIRGNPYPSEDFVAIFRMGYEDWIFIKFEEYDQIRTLLDFI